MSDGEVSAWYGHWPSGQVLSTSSLFGATPAVRPSDAPVSPLGKHYQLADVTALFRRWLDMSDDWDGFGARATNPRSLTIAAELVRSILDVLRLDLPDVMGSSDGGVLVEWERGEVGVQFAIDDAGEIEVYIRRGLQEEEGPLAACTRAAADALGALEVV